MGALSDTVLRWGFKRWHEMIAVNKWHPQLRLAFAAMHSKMVSPS
jgi:hypothetical protein